MREYRIRAKFRGPVYSDRTYKRKVFFSKYEALEQLREAREYYNRPPYAGELVSVTIEGRHVSEWEQETETR